METVYFQNSVTESTESQPTSLLKVTIDCDTHWFLNRNNNLLVNNRQQNYFSRIKMSDFVTVNVSNSQNDVVSFEKKLPKDIKIGELKVFFHQIYKDDQNML